MGSTCCQANKCPTHSSQKISKICMSKTCLQPLCLQCIEGHRALHRQLGYPPKIQQYDQVVNSIKKYRQKMSQIAVNSEAKLQLLPKSMLIKQLTHQYFTERTKRNNSFGSTVAIEGVLTDLELWSVMKEKPWIKSQVQQFLKQNLKPNKDVTGSSYTYLYQ